MFCYVDRYFVILFGLLHFLSHTIFVSVSLVSEYGLITSYHIHTHTDDIYIYIYIHTVYICVR